MQKTLLRAAAHLPKILALALMAGCALAPAQGWADGTGDLSSSKFMFDPSGISIIGGKSGNPSSVTGGGVNNVNALAAKVVRLMLIALSILCTCVVVAGGLMMAVSAGNEERVSFGKSMVTYSLLGLFIALASYSIIALVGWGLS